MDSPMRLSPLSDVLGTEITGFDAGVEHDDRVIAELLRALDETSLLVFRDQELTPAQQVAFSRRFGDLEIYPMTDFTLRDQPEVLIVSTVIENGKPIGIVDAGQYWHSDSSWRPIPSLGSLFYARELPPEGGDTLFVNMHAAYQALPEPLRERLIGLSADHDYARRNAALSSQAGGRPKLTVQQASANPPVAHPVVRAHPGTGKPALFINQGFTARILGIPEQESAELLDFLFAHILEPRFMYRHQWRHNDMLFWDNRGMIHRATPLPAGTRRTMYRTTIKGDKPQPWHRGSEGAKASAPH